MANADIASTLTNMDRGRFIQEFQRDLAEATRIAQRGGLQFETPNKAVYHYRKHGAEFPKFIAKRGNEMKVYLGPVKNHVVQPKNLMETVQLSVRKRMCI